MLKPMINKFYFPNKVFIATLNYIQVYFKSKFNVIVKKNFNVYRRET